MLIIGGVAVPLYVLPEWAQHGSAFFPGRYAVQALQTAVTGDGLDAARFSLFALLMIGAAGVVAGAMMFRWDAQQRFAALRGKGWVAVALGAWLAVGLLAQADGRAVVSRTTSAPTRAATVDPEPPVAAPVLTPQERAATAPPPRGQPSVRRGSDQGRTRVKPRSDTGLTPAVPPAVPALTLPPRRASAPAPGSSPTASMPSSTAPVAPPAPAGPATPWREVTMDDVKRPSMFAGLPPDEGVVTPLAPADEEPDPFVAKELERLRDKLLEWEPGLVEDPVQRVRNYLYVAVVPDMFQFPIERYVPWIVLERLQEEFIREDLIKLLYWVGRRPYEGDESAIDELRPLGLQNGPDDVDELRRRTSIYARKLLRRVLEE
jgi:hypothetical protein